MIKRYMALIFALLLPIWCAAQTSNPGKVPDGFKPLFDGRSLTGWHTAPRLGVPKTAAEALAPTPANKPPRKSA